MTVPYREQTDRQQRFVWLEDQGTDFPFYAGQPAGLSVGQWCLLMLAVSGGFAAVILPVSWPGGALGAFIPALLLSAIPLGALALMCPRHWRKLFGPVGWRELRLMCGFALLNLVVSMTVGLLLKSMVGVESNQGIVGLTDLETPERVLFFARTALQLLGEEVMTILPFLALLALCTRGLGMGRRSAMVVAWLLSAVLFALAHLPAYGWNLLQCLVVIGSARLVLTLPWIMTKNLWVSTGAHVINDWLLFSMGLLAATLAKAG